jgi:hypothetical protein
MDHWTLGREEEQGSGGITRKGAAITRGKIKEGRKKQREGRCDGGGGEGRGTKRIVLQFR